MRFSRDPKLQPNLNITPLIDVVLMLLIFFMISTSFIFQPGIMIKLPRADHSDTTTQKGAQIMITADEGIYFERIRSTMSELEMQMRQFPDKSLLLIKADQNVPHGTVVQAMNHAKNAGFQRIAIATRPTGE
ncbi:MAG TPA: biopolymer transporter ExbD [bacterium]|nr:biopolymer transporter ExbD [bacterium]